MKVQREKTATGWHYLDPDQLEFAVMSAALFDFDISGCDSFIAGEQGLKGKQVLKGKQGLTLDDKAVERLLEIRGEAFAAFKDDDRRAWRAFLSALFWACVAHGMEENARRGAKVQASAGKANVGLYGTPEEKAKRRELIWKTFDEVVADNPRWGKTLCYEEVARRLTENGEKFCTSEKTIRRALKRRP